MTEHPTQRMTLKTLLASRADQFNGADVSLSGLALDSRKVEPGELYVALQGTGAHGLDFVQSALEKGASAVLVDSNDFERAVQLLPDSTVASVPGLPLALGSIAADWYGNPSKDMQICGVTGTDGKTSVSRFIRDALRGLGYKTGYIGTIGWGLDDKLLPNPLTTPDPITLQSMLSEMYRNGARFIALEVSSHALVQGRVNGVSFDVAVLTNLGQDHLDYHGDVESYQQAKRKLFEWDSLSAAVINTDDEFGERLAQEIDVAVTGYSAKANSSQIKARQVIANERGLSFELHDHDFTAAVDVNLLGDFNVDNLLACYSTLRCFGMSQELAADSLKSIGSVPGRMEHFRAGDSVNAVVDFAHTPQALEASLRSIRSHCKGKLTVVFGCGGDRDPGKRPRMGAVAGQLAEVIIVTDDNPRTEPSDQIISQIVKGIPSSANYTVISDRTEAIVHALDNANGGDWVLIAGKGHEDYQIVGSEMFSLSDRETVRQWTLDHTPGLAGGIR